MNWADIRLTTTDIWVAIGIIFLVDLFLIAVAGKFIQPERYRKLAPTVGIVAFLFWAAIWSAVFAWGWDWFYAFIFPEWIRPWAPVWGIGFAFIGWFIWWVSLRLPGSPAINFCLLGGVEGLLSHLWAIFGLGAVAKVPVMQNTDPWVVLLFAIGEKICYWSIILLFASFADRVIRPFRIERNI